VPWMPRRESDTEACAILKNVLHCPQDMEMEEKMEEVTVEVEVEGQKIAAIFSPRGFCSAENVSGRSTTSWRVLYGERLRRIYANSEMLWIDVDGRKLTVNFL